jgi:hypothetical protein
MNLGRPKFHTHRPPRPKIIAVIIDVIKGVLDIIAIKTNTISKG